VRTYRECYRPVCYRTECNVTYRPCFHFRTTVCP
jgi:hypothetical protein